MKEYKIYELLKRYDSEGYKSQLDEDIAGGYVSHKNIKDINNVFKLLSDVEGVLRDELARLPRGLYLVAREDIYSALVLLYYRIKSLVKTHERSSRGVS